MAIKQSPVTSLIEQILKELLETGVSTAGKTVYELINIRPLVYKTLVMVHDVYDRIEVKGQFLQYSLDEMMDAYGRNNFKDFDMETFHKKFEKAYGKTVSDAIEAMPLSLDKKEELNVLLNKNQVISFERFPEHMAKVASYMSSSLDKTMYNQISREINTPIMKEKMKKGGSKAFLEAYESKLDKVQKEKLSADIVKLANGEGRGGILTISSAELGSVSHLALEKEIVKQKTIAAAGAIQELNNKTRGKVAACGLFLVNVKGHSYNINRILSTKNVNDRLNDQEKNYEEFDASKSKAFLANQAKIVKDSKEKLQNHVKGLNEIIAKTVDEERRKLKLAIDKDNEFAKKMELLPNEIEALQKKAKQKTDALENYFKTVQEKVSMLTKEEFNEKTIPFADLDDDFSLKKTRQFIKSAEPHQIQAIIQDMKEMHPNFHPEKKQEKLFSIVKERKDGKEFFQPQKQQERTLEKERVLE